MGGGADVGGEGRKRTGWKEKAGGEGREEEGEERGRWRERGGRKDGVTDAPRVVVGRVRVVAHAEARGVVAQPVGVRAVVEAHLVLAHVAKVARLTHTARHGVLDAAPAVEGAVGPAVPRAAVVTEKGRRALHGAKAVADAVGLAQHGSAVPLGVRVAGQLGDVLHVGVVVGVVVAGLARMQARLVVRVVVVVARGARAGRVGAVLPVVAHVALAEAKVADAVVGAVVDAVVDVEVPHVVHYLRAGGDRGRLETRR